MTDPLTPARLREDAGWHDLAVRVALREVGPEHATLHARAARACRLAAELLERLPALEQTLDRWGTICVPYASGVMWAIAAAQEAARGD